jgi:hypothetical protein
LSNLFRPKAFAIPSIAIGLSPVLLSIEDSPLASIVATLVGLLFAYLVP